MGNPVTNYDAQYMRQCTNTDVAADAALKEARYDEWRRAQDEVEK